MSANVSCPIQIPLALSLVLMQAYKQKKAYIIAEGPMVSTARNMWKVIYDRECGAIVMLSDLVENGMVCFMYIAL